MGSAGFLFVSAAVNIGHFRVRGQTGGKAWLIASALSCLLLFLVLLRNMIKTAPTSAIALGITLVESSIFEVVYRRQTGRTFRAILLQSGPDRVGDDPGR